MEEQKRNKLLLVLFLGVLMGALDIAIVGPALTAIQAEFGVSTRDLSWTFSIYVLCNLVSTPIMAKLSDRWGRRNIYILDVFLFGVGSLVVASSGSFSGLLRMIASRLRSTAGLSRFGGTGSADFTCSMSCRRSEAWCGGRLVTR